MPDLSRLSQIQHSNQTPVWSNRLANAGLVALAILGGWAVYHATTWGPWAYSDAAGYIAAARNLSQGVGLGLLDAQGTFKPGISHPPLFVLVLAGLSKTGLDPLTAARWLHIALFALAIAGSGFALYIATYSVWAGLLASALILLAPQVMLLFVSAMSEPLFLVTGFGSLMLLSAYLSSSNRRYLIGAAGLAALALLTRYVGIAFSATGFLTLIVLSAGTLRTRFLRGALFVLGSLFPLGLFLLWAYALQPTQPFRTGAYPVDLAGGLEQFGRMLAGVWWTWKPLPPPEVIRLLFDRELVYHAIAIIVGLGLVGFGVLLVFAAVRYLGEGPAGPANGWPGELARVLGTFIPVYILVFLAAFLLSDPVPDVDSRTMLPLLPAMLLLLVLGLWYSVSKSDLRWKPVLAMIVGLSVLVGYSPSTYDIVAGLHRTGAGYTAREWRTSPTLEYALALPRQLPIITNGPEAVLLYTGQLPYRLPLTSDDHDDVFGAGNSPAELAFRDRQGLVILFENPVMDGLRDSSESDLELYRLILAGSDVLKEFSDGTVYEH